MVLPLLRGVHTGGEIWQRGLLMVGGPSPLSWGGFSTFLPHSERGVIRMAEVCSRRGGANTATRVFQPHTMSQRLPKVKMFAIVASDAQGSSLMKG